MPLNPQFSTPAVVAQVNAIGNALNNGYLRVYDGAQPTDADTAITDQVLLAELRLAADAFPLSTDGIINSNAITADPSANAAGEATWCRVLASDGTTVWFDGTVGTEDANLILPTTDIVAGATVSAPNGITVVVPKSGEVVSPTLEE